jgi:hypothetical protein
MNGMMLIDTAKSRSACNALHAARYHCVCNARNGRCTALATPQKAIAALWRHLRQPRFGPLSTAVMPCAAYDTHLAPVEST